MRKSIIVRENDLLKIKKNMVGSSNTASHNTVCVNEARPEVDEFELGQESDNPPLGGNYSHVNEVYNSSVRGDMDRIDYIDYVPHSNPREEGYTEDNITEFEPYYELMCYDIDGNIIFSGELTLNELFDYFPDRIIHMMSNKEGRKVSKAEWRIEDILSWDTKPNDINNVEEVNAIAKRIQPGGPSSYILTDGDIVSFPDHAQITSIEGMTPSKFVGLGNIRVGKGLAELSKEPNRLQLNVLKDFLRGEDEICLDIVKDSGRMYPECICSAIYNNAPIDRLINDIVYYFKDGIKPQGNMAYESKMKSKNLIEDMEIEVDSSDIDLSSFKKKNCLAPIWHEDGTLNSKIRIKLLDIADDFWKFVNLTWVKPNGIILTGSICNFNWSSYSDIDLHLIVDFDEIDEKTEFVQDYLNGKKNEWNNEHEGLKILGYPVEVYVQDLGEMPKSGGIYDLEQDEWIKKPNIEDVKPIGLNKFSIKDKAATIMTIIDDMYDALNSTNDSYEIQQIGDDAKYLWKKIKNMRKQSLETTGESGNGNIVYKCMRRLGYLEKLWKLSTLVYDRTNSITEGKSKSEKNKYTVYINGKKDDNFSDMNWKRKPKVGKGFYCGGAVFKIEKVTDDSIYAIEENIGYDEVNSINENVEYGDNIFTMAIERFGATNDIRECGYILPNGMMLDFSGRHTLSKGTDSSHLAGRRAIDHRDISDVGWSIDGNTKNFDLSMEDFIKLGAIRTHVSRTYSSINLFKKPTQQQLDVISRIIRFANGCIDVEIGDGDESLSYAEYDGVKPSVVIAQLNRFFNEGISLMESKEVLNEYLEKDYNLPYPLYRNESIKKYITLLKEKSLLGEEFNADGSSNGNPYKKRWDAERKALKDFICNYGVLMQSKEDNKQGRLYKCLWDKTLSNLIGYNYCLAVQYDEINNKPKSTIYVRACDRFTPNIRRNLQYDSRGQDNQIRANF